MSLAPLYAVKAVVKAVLPPDAPAAAGIPTQGHPLYMHTLVEQLKIVALAGLSYRLYGQLPNANGTKKVQAYRAEKK